MAKETKHICLLWCAVLCEREHRGKERARIQPVQLFREVNAALGKDRLWHGVPEIWVWAHGAD